MRISEIFKRILFYKRQEMGKNGNEKMDEKDAAHYDYVCLNDFHVR